MVWYPNNSTKFYAVQLDDILFGNHSMKDKFCKNKTIEKDEYFSSHDGSKFEGCKMVIDSGTYSVKYPKPLLSIIDNAHFAHDFDKLGCSHPNANETITFVASGTGIRY
jgi:hypothetical protein